MTNPDLLTVEEAAALLRVHKSTIYRLLKAQRLPGAFRVGSDWRIVRNTLEKALQELMDLSYQVNNKGKKK